MSASISSPRNPRVVDAVKLHEAKHEPRAGLTIVEGPGPIEAVRQSSAPIRELFALSEAPGVTTVTAAVLARISGTESPRGPLAIVEIPTFGRPRPHDTVVLWEVADPGNAGALVRTAAFMGFDVAVCGGADVWSPKAIRAAAGAQFSIHVSSIESLADLAVETTVATTVEGGRSPDSDVPHPVALILGNEAAGLPADVIGVADRVVTLAGAFESLNVAVAGGLLMDRYRLLR